MPMTLRSRRLPQGFWKGATSRKTRATKATRAVKKLAPRTRKAIATIAKKVVRKSQETKYASQFQEYAAMYGDTDTGGSGPQVFTCVPLIAQGDESINRQGLKISPVRHRTDLRFVFNDDPQISSGSTTVPASQAGWDITVHIWYGFAKRYKSTQDVNTNSATILANMLDIGNGSVVRFSGELTDEMYELNKEFVSLKHKKFRMYKNAGLANVCDVTAPALSTPMSEAKRVSLTWKPPKTLVYKGEAETQPENYAPFIVIGYVHNDATQASNHVHSDPTTDPTYVSAIKMARMDKLWYKDA